jgi:hypothetical protein
MTNLLSGVIILVVTNWVHIGKYDSASGQHYDIQQADVWTNYVGWHSFRGQRWETPLVSDPGPTNVDRRAQALIGAGVTLSKFAIQIPPPVPIPAALPTVKTP